MISNKRLDRVLKKYQLTLVVCTEDERTTHLRDWYEGLGAYCPLWTSFRVWSNVHWMERTVVVGEGMRHEGQLIHELMHAAYPLAPDENWRESHHWMYAAERLLAKELGCLDEWVDYFRDTPIDDIDNNQQRLWKYMDARSQRMHRTFWKERLEEEGLRPEGKLRLPVWPGQAPDPRIPRGLHLKA